MDLATPAEQQIDRSHYSGHPILLESFEGPLDLLLEIIKKNREEIWDISISRITKQYLEHLEELRHLNIEVAGEFLVMASTLMRIKSQMLLPKPSFLTEEDEEGEPLTREGLIAKLIEYRRFKEAAQMLRIKEQSQGRRFGRGSTASLEAGYQLPLREPRTLDLVGYFRNVLTRGTEPLRHEVQLEEIELEDQMELIRTSLGGSVETEPLPEGSGQGIRFTRLLNQKESTMEVVVTFLAVLELGKLQGLNAHQWEPFAEIWLTACVPQELPSISADAEEAGQ